MKKLYLRKYLEKIAALFLEILTVFLLVPMTFHPQLLPCNPRGVLAMFAYGGVRAMFLGLKFHLKAIFWGLKFAI